MAELFTVVGSLLFSQIVRRWENSAERILQTSGISQAGRNDSVAAGFPSGKAIRVSCGEGGGGVRRGDGGGWQGE